MTFSPCPSQETLFRALNGKENEAVLLHVAGCRSCQAAEVGVRRGIAIARELPVRLPDQARRDEVRAMLLARAAVRPVRSSAPTSRVAGALVLAVAAVLTLWVSRRGGKEPPRSHVVVRSGVAARYTVTSPPPRETIRLWEGAIDLDVQPLGPRDQMIVVVGDAEVEVRGTRFQVTAQADRLIAVDVTHGRVEVRPRGARLAILGAGERWRPAPEAAPVMSRPPPLVQTPARTPPAGPRARRITARATAGVERALRPTRQEVLYDDAWDALRSRRFEEAARGFGEVLEVSPSGTLADEAAFWQATALARDGAANEAVAAFRRFLTKYDGSERRGEASAILGWLLVDAHRPDEAAPLFEAALRDPKDTVRESARQGLVALPWSAARR